jgi:TonB family protein
LQSNPTLAGSVTVRFVIGRLGAVSNVAVVQSSVDDPALLACVVRSFHYFSLSAPEDGVVTVSYPIHFAPP